MRQPNWKMLALAGTIAVLGAAWLAWQEARERGAEPAAVPAAPALHPMASRATQRPAAVAVALSPDDRAFVASLRERFGARMDSKHTQIRLIEQLIAYLMRHYPEDWQSRVPAFLRELFPSLADALHDRYERLMRYNEWLRVNRERLLAMESAERRQALWAARSEAFGDDAGEIFAAQRQAEQVRDTLASLETMQGIPVEQKLDVFLDAVNETYGDDAARLLEGRGTELMNGFLSVAAVQDDLHALGPAQRGAVLRDIRQRMGLDQAALARWDSLDRQRDAAWDNGVAYLAERERIQRDHDGMEEEAQLRQLQDDRFGAEADTIRSEEAGGFYRYGQRRRYGRE